MKNLPFNCEVFYQADFLGSKKAQELDIEITSTYDVRDRCIKMYDGSEFYGETGRYMFTDPELTSFEALPEAWGQRSLWPVSLAEIRDRIRVQTGITFQFARCVYYENGSKGLEYHVDPGAFGPTDEVASLSLSTEREFLLWSRRDPSDVFSILLEPGSLLLLGKGLQDRCEHAVPGDESCHQPRLNLTFWKYGWD